MGYCLAYQVQRGYRNFSGLHLSHVQDGATVLTLYVSKWHPRWDRVMYPSDIQGDRGWWRRKYPLGFVCKSHAPTRALWVEILLNPSYRQMAEPLKAGLQGGLFIIGCMLPEGSTYGMVVLWRGRIALKAWVWPHPLFSGPRGNHLFYTWPPPPHILLCPLKPWSLILPSTELNEFFSSIVSCL